MSGNSFLKGTSDSTKVEAGELTEAEKANTKDMAPGEVFAKHDSQDENNPVTDANQLKSLKEGSAAASGGKNGAVAEVLATQAAADAEGEVDSGEALYSSHPISNFRAGRFQFENATLRVSGDDKAEFEKLLENLPPRDANLIKKIDVEAANRIARAAATKRVRGVDTADESSR